MSVQRGVLVTHDEGVTPMAETKTTTTTPAPKGDKASAPAANQQPTPADAKYEPGHEPGDALGPLDVLGFEAFPQDAKDAIKDAIKDAATNPPDYGVQPHGIANLTQPSPVASAHELAEHPDEVAKKQEEAFTQTAVGQAIAQDDEQAEK